jgi:hypothetical protein
MQERISNNKRLSNNPDAKIRKTLKKRTSGSSKASAEKMVD